MIYSRWGSEIKIIARHGKHLGVHNSAPKRQVKERGPNPPPAELITVEYGRGPGTERKCLFDWTLRADGGWKEISEAIEKAPMVELTPDQLEKAIWDEEAPTWTPKKSSD